MADPLVSIVIPFHSTYAEYLPDCLGSVLRQSYRWEIIIVDDASPTEAGAAIADALGDPRIRVVRHAENRGQAAGRNTGMRLAAGELLMALDCDDLLAPIYLEKLVGALRAHPDHGAAYSDYRLFGATDSDLRFPLRDTRALLREQWIPHPGTLVRRSLFEASGGYCEDPVPCRERGLGLFPEPRRTRAAGGAGGGAAVLLPPACRLHHHHPLRPRRLRHAGTHGGPPSGAVRPLRDAQALPGRRLPGQRQGVLDAGRAAARGAPVGARCLAGPARLRPGADQDLATDRIGSRAGLSRVAFTAVALDRNFTKSMAIPALGRPRLRRISIRWADLLPRCRPQRLAFMPDLSAPPLQPGGCRAASRSGAFSHRCDRLWSCRAAPFAHRLRPTPAASSSAVTSASSSWRKSS
ncbi:glycosyltransferase family 2 protein [Siccirubricoccus deserti]